MVSARRQVGQTSVFGTDIEKYVQTSKTPTLVMFVGHRSHISLDLLQWAESKNMILFVLPPHCSYLLHPLDIGCFGHFKQIYNTDCKNYLRKKKRALILLSLISVSYRVQQIKGDCQPSTWRQILRKLEFMHLTLVLT